MGRHVDVIVVGAGPAGLLLAIELKLGGAEVLLLERLAAPSAAVKANAVGPLGAEALERRSMGPQLAAAEDRGFAARGPEGAEMQARAARIRGSFAGFPIRAGGECERRMRWVPQQDVEAILGARAAALDIEIRRGCEVTAIAQHRDGVEAEWSSPEGQGAADCGWLVGCDGGRSVIRKMAGFVVSGTPASVTLYQCVVDLDHAERLARGLSRTAEGAVVNGPRPRWLALHDFSGPPPDRDAPVTREEIESVLRRISGADVRVTEIDQANRFSDITRLVDSYRQGRVLLAGDAAHVHSPAGGQGLSLGLVDAANLGWKLAAVARGDKPETLLDSYTAERRPVAQAVLANTLAQTAIARPDPQSSAMREILARLIEFDSVNDEFDALMSGLATRYDLGSENDRVGRIAGDRPIDGGTEGTALFAEMAGGDGVLIDRSPHGCAASLAGDFTRLRHFRSASGPSLLLRPDGCIAWAGDPGETAGLEAALETWFMHGGRSTTRRPD